VIKLLVVDTGELVKAGGAEWVCRSPISPRACRRWCRDMPLVRKSSAPVDAPPAGLNARPAMDGAPEEAIL